MPRSVETQSHDFRHLIPALTLFLVLQAVLFAPRLNSDGAYYYEFARSMVIQKDLNFDDEREFFTWEMVPVFREFLPGDWKNTGYPPNIFSFGPAMVWMPMLTASDSAVRLINRMGGRLSTNGYSLPYRLIPMWSSVVFGLLTLLLCDLLAAQAGLDPRHRGAAAWVILGASHFAAFLFATPAFSHALSVFCTALFLWVWYRWRDAFWGKRDQFLYGLLAGVMIVARWQNAFCLILPMADALAGLISAPNRRKLLDRTLSWAVFAAGVLIAVSPQLIVTGILYGTPVTDPQGTGGMHWLHPRFQIVFFGGTNGLFIVNPVLLPAVAGLLFLFRKNYRLALGFILLFVVQSYINAVRRDWAGVGFGMRRFLNMMPLYVTGMALLFQKTGFRWRRIPRYLLYAAGGFLTIWNILLMAQYYLSRLGAPWTRMTRAEMISAQWTLAPKLLLKFFRLGLLGSVLEGQWMMGGLGLILLGLTAAIAWQAVRGPCRLFSGFRRRTGWMVVILGLILSVNGLLAVAWSHAEPFFTVNLVAGKGFGKLRKLMLNPRSGYQGVPAGVELGPGLTGRVIAATAEYQSDAFILPGRLRFHRDPLVLRHGVLSFQFARTVDAHDVLIISRSTGQGVVPGTPLGRITVHSRNHPPESFVLRHGLDTGVPGVKPADSHAVLVRNYPIMNRIEDRNVKDVRTVFPLQTGSPVHRLDLELLAADAVWEIHGIALH